MKCLSREDWAAYLETVDRARFDRHIDACERCRATREGLLEADRRLTEAGFRERVRPADPAALARIRDGVRFRVRRSELEEEQPGVRLRQLRSILSALCGRSAAAGALRKAAMRSSAPSAAPFAANLGSIVKVICGEQAARLVEHAAEGIREDLVA